jgi:hypothetical protein
VVVVGAIVLGEISGWRTEGWKGVVLDDGFGGLLRGCLVLVVILSFARVTRVDFFGVLLSESG